MPPRVTCTPASPPASRRVAALIRRTGPTTLIIVWMDTHSSSINTPALTQNISIECSGTPEETEVLSVAGSLSGSPALSEAAAEPTGAGSGSRGCRVTTWVAEAGTGACDPCGRAAFATVSRVVEDNLVEPT